MDRITHITIQNVRAIEYAEIELGKPMTVLIGENGAGKSTIVECLEILRKMAEPSFVQQFHAVHRGLPALLRRGALWMELGLTIALADGDSVKYSVRLEKQGTGTAVAQETLQNTADGFKILESTQGRLMAWDARPNAKKFFQTVISANSLGIVWPEVREMDSRISAVVRVLAGIEVHLPFDTVASWGARTYQRQESLRVAATLFPAERLSLRGMNLANAWSELRNRETSQWEHTMGLVQLGLGSHVDSVLITPDAGGGNVYLALRLAGMSEPILAADLSDGQLTWLAFVAMVRLNPARTLLAVDEPELHLHPALLGRVVMMLATLPDGGPVVISTHADRVLELLDDPADAIRVCSLDGSRAEVSRIDADALPRWLEKFGDCGQLRASGYLPRVLVPTSRVASSDAEAE